MKRRPEVPGGVLGGVDWSRWSVVLLKPDCVRRNLVAPVLDRIAVHADIVHQQQVVVEDWQVFVHYWDLLVDRDWLDVDVPACLRSAYVGRPVVVALAHGPDGIAKRLRGLLGHFDPAQADRGTIRADLGADSIQAARAAGRLVENLVHTSDDPEATCRDFGTWFGANQYQHVFPEVKESRS
ncbi:nucleoside-diphosphate kinase [Streptomyces sp. SL13]|uniref:nucleoside-diphosphate kinase n=1 Tax=Streptantibioticus silvisoli TaxID=2705255 RepID=A0AA90K7K2_9ACTN|nr:nucleoside-diphosphate kinase [Streptantibioticus silvisoli]MDI5968382.1 nucleoside-diphosphate kinase [Streptantibioticus silvisoli]